MKTSSLLLSIFLFSFAAAGFALESRTVIGLSGTWDFEQTKTAFAPEKFTRKIPVPGLIFLAQPRIEQYEAYCDGTYEPRYSWYRRKFTVPADLKGRQAVLTILKSKYVTQAFLNGIELGQSVSCYTPVEFPASHALRFGQENELLVRLDDRKRLPSQAAGSTDKEKVTYWPGIWDEVYISFTGPLRLNNVLLLPSVARSRVTAKVRVRSFLPAQVQYGDRMQDSCTVEIAVREKESGTQAGAPVARSQIVKRDNFTVIEVDVPIDNPRLWSPEDPFIYTAAVTLRDSQGKTSDRIEQDFGLRDFTRSGKHFTLNGEKILLRGTNITLYRFFEDPNCKALPWDRQWVTRLLDEIPGRLDWNAMRICVGIAPKFWYDIADEAGLMIQNEWFYWQSHGWDEQIRAEYTDWVWADGSHPSVVIWDAINENWDDYIGNVLIPELKKLDPTRIWDAGYMTSEHMTLDEMDEPHPYMVFGHRTGFNDKPGDPPYPLGDLHYWGHSRNSLLSSSAAQLANEYGWVWLWRNGSPAKLTTGVYDFYLGSRTTPQQRREFQAYWVQLQTEWLRTERSLAGVLVFCYLTNDLGFTGDWFLHPIAELRPAPALKWLKHCFAPAAVFIDLEDARYSRHVPAREPGSLLSFTLVGVNDNKQEVKGRVEVRLLDSSGSEIERKSLEIAIPAYYKKYEPVSVKLPKKAGGYLLLAEFFPQGSQGEKPAISRRYLRVGEADSYEFYDCEVGW